MAVTISTIVGKPALDRLKETNVVLKETTKILRAQIKVITSLNTKYATAKNTTQLLAALNKQEQANLKITQAQNKVVMSNNKLEEQSLKIEAQKLRNAKLIRDAQIKETKEIERLVAAKKKEAAATEKARLAQEKANKTKKKSGGLFRSVTKSILAASVAMVGFRTVINVFKNSLKTIANFEEAMSKVKAVTGALPSEFKSLNTNAKELGSTTSKTATEVAGLQLEFSKLGFSTAEILAATEATISLSIAAGSDLAESAVVAASTVRGFGLNASETQRVVDVMAKSFSSSALDLEKFKTSMSAVAPVAKANGKDIEFVTARLSVLSDAGLDASTSGTSLRNMFLELSKKGLTWEQGLAKINNSTNKGTTALDLFGKRGATASLILADNITKAEGLEKAYDGAAGSAEEMARIMEDNLIGDTKKLSSAWEGFILGLNKGEGTISNVFRGLTQWLTKVVTMFNMANKSYRELVEEAKDNKLSDFIAGDVEEVQFLTDKLGDYERALNLVIASLEQNALNWMTAEETEIIEARIVALKAMRNIIDDTTKATDENTDAADKNTKAIHGTVAEVENLTSKLSPLTDAWNKVIETYGVDFAIEIKEGAELFEEQTKSESKVLTDELKKRVQAYKTANKEEVIDDNSTKEKKRAIRDELASQIQSLGSQLFDYQQSLLDKELDALQTNYDAKITAAEGDTEKQEALARELAQKQYEIQLEQAKSERNQALFDIAISTAVGAVKAFESGPAGIALAAITVAAGLAQAAIVSSQPLPSPPQYHDGEFNTPSTFIAGDGPEAQTRELIVTKDGKMMLSPNQATLYDGMAGSTVIPNKQTEQILKSVDMANGGAFDASVLANKLDAINDTAKMFPKALEQLNNKKTYGRGGNMSRKAETRFRN